MTPMQTPTLAPCSQVKALKAANPGVLLAVEVGYKFKVRRGQLRSGGNRV